MKPFLRRVIFIIIFFNVCSQFDDYYPSSGEFCDLIDKSNECIQIQLDKKIFIYKENEYPLISLNRVNYQTIIFNQMYSINILAEHRVEFEGPEGKKVYYRKKKLKK